MILSPGGPRTARLWWGVVGVAALAVPLVTANTYYLYLAMTIAIMVIVCTGLNILAGLSGQISLGHAGLYAIGAYTAGIVGTRLGLGLWSALLPAVTVTAVVGALLALAALRVSGPYLAMVTIAFGIIVEGAAVEWVALTGGPGGIFNIPKPALGSLVLPLRGYYLVVVVTAALALIATRNVMRSAWGRAFVAVKDSEVAAESLGLGTYGLRAMAFTLSAAFAGAGGCLFTFLQGYLSPDSFTLQASILFLLIVLFGGLGTLAGPLVGGLVLVLLPELLQQFVEYRLILYGGLLLFSVYFLPAGVVGALRGRLGPPPSGAGAASASPLPGPSVGGLARAPEPAARTSCAAVPALVVDGVSVAFGGLQALDGVGLAVGSGSIHSLIGPNGAGKTTLVNIISGFYRPDRGRLEFEGRSIAGLAPAAIARRGLVRTFQTPQLFEDLSVRENVMVGAAGHRLGALTAALAGSRAGEARLRDDAGRLLAEVGLEAWAEAPARSLPFGLRRRLEMARALAAGATMLLLDEPAAGLSPAEMEDLGRRLEALRAGGRTILLIEHHMDLVMAVSDRVTVLDEGRLIADGEPEAVQRDPAVVAAYLGG